MIKNFFALAAASVVVSLSAGAASASTIKRTTVPVPEWDVKNVIDFQSLPFHLAITRVKGSGKRKIAVFGDPNCPYTKQLERQLEKYEDITIYSFPGPFLASGRSKQVVAQVYCQPDNQKRAQAWENLVLRGQQPPKVPGCASTVGEQVLASWGNLRSGQGYLYRQRSPVVVYQNNLAAPGLQPDEDIEFLLEFTP